MRIGIIGIGDICKKAYLSVIGEREDVELVLCTRNKNTIEEVKRKYRINEGYTSIKELIESGIDGAMIHSSTESHFHIAKELLENNIAVYVDKPISYNYEETKKLYKLSKKYNTKVMIGFNRRFAPKVKELKELGKPDIIIIEKNRVNLPSDPRVFIADDFIHVVDTLRFLMGKAHNEMSVKYKKDERGLLNVVLTLSNENTTAIGIMNRDNGIGEETIEYMSPGKKTIVTSLVKSTKLIGNTVSIEEFGDWVPTLYKRGFEDIIEEFISCVKEQRDPNPTLEDSIITHRVCEEVISIIEQR